MAVRASAHSFSGWVSESVQLGGGINRRQLLAEADFMGVYSDSWGLAEMLHKWPAGAHCLRASGQGDAMRKLLCSFPILLALVLTGTAVAAGQTAPYTRTVIVPANGSTTANGAALIAALANLNPAPNYGARWLIKLEPGIYNVGTTPVVMRQYVDIEGSGIVETSIQGAVEPPPGFLLGGLVQGANKSEIRSLTISCYSESSTAGCQALSLLSASPRLTHVRILVAGAGTGVYWGFRTTDSGPILDDVEITVSASGSYNYGIVYGGQSTLNIARSSINVLNATSENLGIMIKGEFGWSPMRDSSVTASGGQVAMGFSISNPTRPIRCSSTT